MLWTVLAINAAMFFIEAIAGLTAGSASLQADALDFLAASVWRAAHGSVPEAFTKGSRQHGAILDDASIMGTLALPGAWHLVLQARPELRAI